MRCLSPHRMVGPSHSSTAQDQQRLSSSAWACLTVRSAGHAACVTYLLKRHANPASTNKQGKTAMDLAKTQEVRDALQPAEQEAEQAAADIETAATAAEQIKADHAEAPQLENASAPSTSATRSTEPGPALQGQPATVPDPELAATQLPQQAGAPDPAVGSKRPAESQDPVAAADSAPQKTFDPHKRVARDLFQDDADD